MKGVKVLKFGGTSMGSADAMKKVIAIVRKPHKDAHVAAVVVSAMSGVTNELIRCARLAAAKDRSYKKVLKDINKRHVETAHALLGRKNGHKALASVDELMKDLESEMLGVYRLRELSPAALDYAMSFGERLSAQLLAFALCQRGVRAEYLNARNVIVTDGHFG